MSQYFLGIDPSLNATGLAVVEKTEAGVIRLVKTTSVILNSTKEFPKLFGMARVEHILEQLEEFMKTYDFEMCAIENYAYGVQKSRSVFDLGELGGCIRLLFHRRGIRLIEIPPQTVKSRATGKGNADKEDVKAGMEKILNCTLHSHDEADAAGVAVLIAEMGEEAEATPASRKRKAGDAKTTPKKRNKKDSPEIESALAELKKAEKAQKPKKAKNPRKTKAES